MTISEARQAFESRYDLWATSVAEKEVHASFPHFRIFKGGMTWKFYEFVRQLSNREQLMFVRTVRKSYYLRTSNSRGEPISVEEQAFLDRYYDFCLQQRGLELEIPPRRRAGEKIKFASKKQLQRSVTEHFLGAFGQTVLGIFPTPPNESSFRMRFGGWIVSTDFTFGRQENLIAYRHAIISEEVIRHPDNPEITAPALWLAQFSWLGICPMQWEFLLPEDVKPACDSVVELCREAFDVLPKLLHGIERDKVTAE